MISESMTEHKAIIARECFAGRTSIMKATHGDIRLLLRKIDEKWHTSLEKQQDHDKDYEIMNCI